MVLGGPFTRGVAERNFAAALARLREHGFGRRWIDGEVETERRAGLTPTRSTSGRAALTS